MILVTNTTINTRNICGRASLFDVIILGNEGMARKLTEHGGEIDIEDNAMTPLWWVSSSHREA